MIFECIGVVEYSRTYYNYLVLNKSYCYYVLMKLPFSIGMLWILVGYLVHRVFSVRLTF